MGVETMFQTIQVIQDTQGTKRQAVDVLIFVVHVMFHLGLFKKMA
jgi:hypothetical protein